MYRDNHYDNVTRKFLKLGVRDDSLDFLSEVEIKSSDVKALLSKGEEPYFDLYYQGLPRHDMNASYMHHFGLAALPDGSDHNADPKTLTRADVVSKLIDDLDLDEDETTTAGDIAEAINEIARKQGGYYQDLLMSDDRSLKHHVDLKPEYMLYTEDTLLPLIVKSVCEQKDSSLQKQTILALAPTLCMTNQERMLNFVNSLLFAMPLARAENGILTIDMVGEEHLSPEEFNKNRESFLACVSQEGESHKMKADQVELQKQNLVDVDIAFYNCCPKVAGKERISSIGLTEVFSQSEIRNDLLKRNFPPPPFPSKDYGCNDAEDRSSFYQCLHEKMLDSIRQMKITAAVDLKANLLDENNTVAGDMMLDFCTYRAGEAD